MANAMTVASVKIKKHPLKLFPMRTGTFGSFTASKIPWDSEFISTQESYSSEPVFFSEAFLLSDSSTNNVYVLNSVQITQEASIALQAHDWSGTVFVFGTQNLLFLFNLLKLPKVSRVILYESFKDMIAFLKKSLKIDRWEGFRKLQIRNELPIPIPLPEDFSPSSILNKPDCIFLSPPSVLNTHESVLPQINFLTWAFSPSYMYFSSQEIEYLLAMRFEGKNISSESFETFQKRIGIRIFSNTTKYAYLFESVLRPLETSLTSHGILSHVNT